MSQNSQRYGQPLENCKRADQVAAERRFAVGRRREVGERQALVGLEPHLRAAAARRSRRAARSARRSRRRSRRYADSRCPDTFPARPRPTGRPAPPTLPAALARRRMSRICGACTCMPETMTTSAHAKSGVGRARHVLVDEAHLPAVRQVGRDRQQPLRRHEGTDVVHQRIGVREGAEGRRVVRKHAQHVAAVTDGDGTAHRAPSGSRLRPPSTTIVAAGEQGWRHGLYARPTRPGKRVT